MANRRAAFGSVVFFVIAPGTVAGLLPWLLTRWRFDKPWGYALPLRLFGLMLLAAGVVFLVHAFVRFVVEGLGTPAPVAPPTRLVVGGVYRFVRNPMYLAVLSTILGQAAVLWQPILLPYAVVVAIMFVTFVLVYEQPHLRRTFGAEYEAYARAVPGWWPRLTPWRPGT